MKGLITIKSRDASLPQHDEGLFFRVNYRGDDINDNYIIFL